MIQKKLWRQGSKFAQSQAFRIYRFRDGAWSEIILGAVMGAARRARQERLRQAQEAGPQLGVASAETERSRAEQIIRDVLAEQMSDVRSSVDEPPFTLRMDPRYQGGSPETAEAAERRRAAFGPYADSMRDGDAGNSQPHPGNEPLIDPAAAHAAAATEPPRWPYRRRPKPPGEADVTMFPANSNTYQSTQAPERTAIETLDNVIPMPRPIAPAPSPGETSWHVPDHREPMTPPAPEAHIQATVRERADVTVSELPTGILPQGAVNVRITQKTADFQLPLSTVAAGHTIQMLKSRMNVDLLDAPVTETEPAPEIGLATESRPNLVTPAQIAPEEQAVILLGDESVRAPAPEQETVASDIVELLDPPPADADIDDGVYFGSRVPEPEDELEQLSRRFAPRRSGD